MTPNVLASLNPPVTNFVNEVNIHTESRDCIGDVLLAIDTTTKASAVWTANRLIFVPFITVENLLVDRFFWRNGATAAGNTDVGVYSEDGQTKLGSSGSTANAGTNVNQVVNVSDFYLPANRRLWLALGCDDSTHTYLRSSLVVTGLDFAGVQEQLGGWSSGLPATITPATPTIAVLPMFGFSGKSVIA